MKLALGAAVLIAGTSAAQARTQLFAARNDAFATPQELTPGPLLKPGTIDYASRELGEPRVYQDGSMRRTVWYRYTARATGRAVVMISSGVERTAAFQVAVYTGTRLASLNRLGRARAEGTAEAPAAAVSFPTTAGQAYMVQVDGVRTEAEFYGDFLVGVQQVGTRGGLAMFRTRPLFVEEVCCDTARVSYVANGFPVAVKLTAGLGDLTGKLTLTSTDDDLGVGQVSIVALANAKPNFAAGTVTTGRLDVVAGRSPAGDVLGRASAPVTVITPERKLHPIVGINYRDSGFSVRKNGLASTLAVIRNTSGVDAVGCRFEPKTDKIATTYDLEAREILKDGAFGPNNRVFDLKTGETRHFRISHRPTAWDHSELYFICANKAMDFERFHASSLGNQVILWKQARVKIRMDSDTEFDEYFMDQQEERTIHLDITNIGEYSGIFTLSIHDDYTPGKAILSGVCVAEGRNDCEPVSGPRELDFDLAVGETRRVTATVRRGFGEGGRIVFSAYTSYAPPTKLVSAGNVAVLLVPK
ncbi:hypothetical protein [Oharaeibacter diazotrophicus]|uniref:hypothetical protein n=1 Tax=Oharaeibacter diazotrophicus TaxID=1920512 RepID=UPI000F81B764|nr:hypothetical protein [Oharaeibacter diazotrophicus]GLS77205.1 hypothetical protein GCM10007904_25420 [Oharaeibacter diazotrophicus]